MSRFLLTAPMTLEDVSGLADFAEGQFIGGDPNLTYGVRERAGKCVTPHGVIGAVRYGDKLYAETIAFRTYCVDAADGAAPYVLTRRRQ